VNEGLGLGQSVVLPEVKDVAEQERVGARNNFHALPLVVSDELAWGLNSSKNCVEDECQNDDHGII